MGATDMGATNTGATGQDHRWSVWANAWTALGLPGVCWAILTMGPGQVAWTAFPVALAALVGLVALQGDRWREQGLSRPARIAWTGRAVLCAVVVVVSSWAMGALVPGLALLQLVSAGATTPPALDLWRRLLGPQPAPDQVWSETMEDPPPSPGPLLHPSQRPLLVSREMTDAQLCAAWRHSFWILRDAPDPATKTALVRQRQRFLEELETRHGPALEAWLASGARACSGPERFLRRDEAGRNEEPPAA